MSGFMNKLREAFSVEASGASSDESDYVELGVQEDETSRVTVRPYVVEDFEHVKPVLDALRQGGTIALVNIRPLKDKDLVELKRAVNKLKKTCDAIGGDIAGFGDDWIAATPSFAQIHRKPQSQVEQRVEQVTEFADEQ